jgi:hypothetical protein
MVPAWLAESAGRTSPLESQPLFDGALEGDLFLLDGLFGVGESQPLFDRAFGGEPQSPDGFLGVEDFFSAFPQSSPLLLAALDEALERAAILAFFISSSTNSSFGMLISLCFFASSLASLI